MLIIIAIIIIIHHHCCCLSTLFLAGPGASPKVFRLPVLNHLTHGIDTFQLHSELGSES